VDASSTQTFATASRDRWRFAQFGNDTIAVNGTDLPQAITNLGSAFTPLGGLPPVAKYVAAANNFVLLFNLSSGALTPTSWWTSAIGNDADWAPDIATQSVNGFLDDTEGEITGAMSLGRDVVVYKERAMYLFEYSGPPIVWQSRIISRRSGALSQDAVVDIGGVHVFMGYDDFYLYDGSGVPQRVPSPVREFLFQRDDSRSLDRNYGYAVAGRYDRVLDVIFWHYPSLAMSVNQTDPPTLDRWIAWAPGRKRWCIGAQNVQHVIVPELGAKLGISYSGFGSQYATWATADTVKWTADTIAGSSNVEQGIVSIDDGKFYSYIGGVHPSAFLRSGEFGDGVQSHFIRDVKPRFARYPIAPTGTRCKAYRRQHMGGQETQTADEELLWQYGSFPLRVDGVYSFLDFSFGEDIEMLGFNVDIEGVTGEE